MASVFHEAGAAAPAQQKRTSAGVPASGLAVFLFLWARGAARVFLGALVVLWPSLLFSLFLTFFSDNKKERQIQKGEMASVFPETGRQPQRLLNARQRGALRQLGEDGEGGRVVGESLGRAAEAVWMRACEAVHNSLLHRDGRTVEAARRGGFARRGKPLTATTMASQGVRIPKLAEFVVVRTRAPRPWQESLTIFARTDGTITCILDNRMLRKAASHRLGPCSDAVATARRRQRCRRGGA